MTGIELTAAERETLVTYSDGTYSCACKGARCRNLPCDNEREDIFTVVESLIAGRVAAALRDAVETAKRQTDLTELVHFDKPSDFRKGVVTVVVALEALAAEFAPDTGENP